jgi:hypothetical protein
LFIVLALNIIISVLIVPVYGAYGSAVSVGICEIVIFVSCFLIIKRILDGKTGKA